jgi:hypothetical protein
MSGSSKKLTGETAPDQFKSIVAKFGFNCNSVSGTFWKGTARITAILFVQRAGGCGYRITPTEKGTNMNIDSFSELVRKFDLKYRAFFFVYARINLIIYNDS